ncbi:MAG: FtsX-like permease family protein, partial [Pseudomonadota bacterium]
MNTNSMRLRWTIQRAFSRHLVKFPGQLTLALIGISVGVAVIVAIQLVKISAYQSFEQASLLNSGSFSHRIVNETGAPLPYELFVELKKNRPHEALSPVAGFWAPLADKPLDSRFYVLGIEPISRNNFNRGKNGTLNIDVPQFMSEPRFAAISRWTARQWGYELGDQIIIKVDSRNVELHVGAILPSQDEPDGLANNTIIIDIGSAQEILKLGRAVTQIDIELGSATAASLAQSLPPKVSIINNRAEVSQLKNITNAFYTNLTALSLMALMMGSFLVYNTAAFLVLQRQAMISRLKALGVTHSEILSASLIEAIMLGVIGGVVGIIVGYFLAVGLLKIVAVTLNDLYFDTAAQAILLDPIQITIAILIGLVMTLCASVLPARAAAMSPLIQSMIRNSNSPRQDNSKLSTRFLIAAFLLMLISGGFLLKTITVLGGFIAIACLLLAGACLCIPFLNYATRILETKRTANATSFLFERVAVRTTKINLSRTGPATAALMIATAAAIGITVMVSSFRLSVDGWLENSLRADYYVSSNFSLSSQTTGIPISDKNQILAIPGVASLTSVTRVRTTMISEGLSTIVRHPVRLSTLELNNEAKRAYTFLSRIDDVWNQWATADVVLATEPFAHRYQLSVGDALTLVTPIGRQQFLVAGVYKDYASEQGSISLSRQIFDQYWSSTNYDGIGIYADQKSSTHDLRDALAASASLKSYQVVSAQALHEQSLEIFDRTFLITNLLKIITTIVAFIGIVGALLAHQLERSHEYGIYRALGFRRGEILRLILTQTLTIGSAAVIVAIPIGLGVAAILIHVINPRSFGWTMNMAVPPDSVFIA